MTREAAMERISELRKSYAVLRSICEGGVDALASYGRGASPGTAGLRIDLERAISEIVAITEGREGREGAAPARSPVLSGESVGQHP